MYLLAPLYTIVRGFLDPHHIYPRFQKNIRTLHDDFFPESLLIMIVTETPQSHMMSIRGLIFAANASPAGPLSSCVTRDVSNSLWCRALTQQIQVLVVQTLQPEFNTQSQFKDGRKV